LINRTPDREYSMEPSADGVIVAPPGSPSSSLALTNPPPQGVRRGVRRTGEKLVGLTHADAPLRHHPSCDHSDVILFASETVVTVCQGVDCKRHLGTSVE